ncbi:MAG: agmatinase [Phycisphaerales bacterium]|nr:agmatinase [Phycisphaerales bacterium]
MPGFLDIPDEFTQPSAKVQIIPVPYDATSTYRKGADKGPQAIIDASAQVEWYDIQTDREYLEQGIHTQAPIECDAEDPIHLAPLVKERVAKALQNGQLPVVLGGEHSVTIGAIEAMADQGKPFSVLQIDAHGDTRDSYHGSTHNHACVMARAREHATFVQVGIRAIDAQELAGMDRDRVYFGHQVDLWTRTHDLSWMDRVIDQLEERVYLTIDLDAFDPAILPSTGTPEPGGMDWFTVNELVRRVAHEREIVGFDVVELCPNSNHHASDFIAAKLVYRVMAEILSNR